MLKLTTFQRCKRLLAESGVNVSLELGFELGGDVGLLFGDVTRLTQIVLQIEEQAFLRVPEVEQLV